jgi:Ring finger domain
MNKDTSLQQQMSRTPAILNTTHDAAAAGSGGEEEEEGGTCIEECPICLCAFEENDEIAWSHNRTCRHLFHRQCIEKWLLNHEECPCCRSLFLFFVNKDDMNDNSNTNNSDGEGPNGRQPSLTRPSSLPIISIADSSMNRDADESSRGDESNCNFARGMDLFYRFASSRRHQASTSSILTAHASTSGTRISPDHHDAEMTLPHLPSINATPPQTFASGALGGNLESWSSSPVRHDELALSSSSMGEITIGTNMDDADDTDLECGTARPPVLSIESVNDSSPSDNVASSVKEGPAC